MINNVYMLILIIFLTALLIYRNKHQTFEPFEDKLYTDPMILNRLRRMLYDVDNLLRREGIFYVVDSGTLLGVIRHGDIIPWDDDVDISVLEQDEHKLLDPNFIKKLHRYGYGFSKFWGGYKIFPLDGKPINKENRNWTWGEGSKHIAKDETFDYLFPFIDISITKNDKNRVVYRDDNVTRVYPNFWHYKHDLLPIRRGKFADFRVNIPYRSKPYLDRAYGENWNKVGYKKYDHLNQQFYVKKEFNL